VTVGDRNQFCTFDQAEKAISDFIRVALPEIEDCLPDPALEKSGEKHENR
jgi:hypothetical protein